MSSASSLFRAGLVRHLLFLLREFATSGTGRNGRAVYHAHRFRLPAASAAMTQPQITCLPSREQPHAATLAPLRVSYVPAAGAQALDVLLAQADVLAVIGFGADAPATHADPRYLHVALQPVDAPAPFEVWRGTRYGDDAARRRAALGQRWRLHLRRDRARRGQPWRHRGRGAVRLP